MTNEEKIELLKKQGDDAHTRINEIMYVLRAVLGDDRVTELRKARRYQPYHGVRYDT